ncbi:hypothetical protein JOF56_002656 [Kibdelosporangium banguiense]|uniref:ABC3 transporter permease C-terminal domain-containing protein n=1 Tax=Kibdelosporangium banguiense TaxID=1365924 RepID=A0ABS4TEK3_9PSEU|nr:FtsX-like permease family protein [Kibdelosporangium banguiense]MBP2322271.1 hypothetical protein [Kibdelosporangium banguiense]
MTPSRWINDLALGLRLAVGGGRISRTGLVRLVLGTIGVGLAVVVLLFAASVRPALEAREARVDAQTFLRDRPMPGADPLYLRLADTNFRGDTVNRTYVRAGGPAAPIPPGIDRLPGPGESYVSPALAKLLASPEGELLRPRFPERIAGTIGEAGVIRPNDLSAIAGPVGPFADSLKVYDFGGSASGGRLRAELLIILVLGVVVLLLPVFIFIASSARIAGAERDQRLAALRLVGSDARQTRRIAAAESLVSALFGLLFGGGVFLLVRSFAADIEIGGENFFPSDLTPSWPLLLLIVVVVPLLAVLTTQFALRRTIIEPLSLVREAAPIRRRLVWRLALIGAGVLMLFFAGMVRTGSASATVLTIVGATLMLLSVPVLLPWLLERLSARFAGGGKPALQLAVRRLQLDSGTPARVVGSLAVVLAGAVALQFVLTAQSSQVTQRLDDGDKLVVEVDGTSAGPAQTALRTLPNMSVDYLVSTLTIEDRGRYSVITIADCATLTRIIQVDHCQDGDGFTLPSTYMGSPGPTSGSTVNAVEPRAPGSRTPRPVVGQIELPAQLPEVALRPGGQFIVSGLVLLTPGALRATPGLSAGLTGMISAGSSDAIEHVRNAIDPFDANVISSGPSDGDNADVRMFLEIRKGLLIGSVFTLLLAAMSLLVVAVEQTRERRRSIAALSATGVPLGTLVRSLLWQNAIPMVIAIAIAVASGLGVAALVSRLTGSDFATDWTTVGLMSVTAGVLILLVTALTLPALRSATRLTALRTE